jgi:hypothetical protein
MPPEDNNLTLMLGEMRGQLREVVHTVNNSSSKIDQLGREVAELKGITSTVSTIDTRVKVLEGDVDALKGERDKRDGALGLVGWCLNHWPGIIGFVGLVGVILVATGKIG